MIMAGHEVVLYHLLSLLTFMGIMFFSISPGSASGAHLHAIHYFLALTIWVAYMRMIPSNQTPGTGTVAVRFEFNLFCC